MPRRSMIATCTPASSMSVRGPLSEPSPRVSPSQVSQKAPAPDRVDRHAPRQKKLERSTGRFSPPKARRKNARVIEDQKRARRQMLQQIAETGVLARSSPAIQDQEPSVLAVGRRCRRDALGGSK